MSEAVEEKKIEQPKKVEKKKVEHKPVETKKSRLEEMRDEYFEFKKQCTKGEENILYLAYVIENALKNGKKK